MLIDFTNACEEIAHEHGIKRKEIELNRELLKKVKEAILEKEKRDYYPLLLPEIMEKECDEIVTFAESVRENFDNLVVVGMGGSILGNELLHFALQGIYGNLTAEKKIYFLDNIDPETNLTLLEAVDLRRTFFNFISKSGNTSETLLNMLLISHLLKKAGGDLYRQSLFTTDPEKGFLRRLGKERNVKTYPIHPLVGGRYSVLSHVGLFGAAFEGIDIKKILASARDRKRHFRLSRPEEESALILPFIQYKLFKEKNININVIFSYSDALEYAGKWYEQLLAESIGKQFARDGKTIFAGITPVVARGPFHQHSTLQLFMEGPFDKLILFLVVKHFRKETYINEETLQYPELKFLRDHRYSELLYNEYVATKYALSQNHRPNISLEIEEINEESIGELIYFFELEVLALGELLHINPIDQPSVEVGKKITHALMGDENYKEVLKTIEKLENLDKLILD